MVIFDVVQVVSPGALTSTPAGRWHVFAFDREAEAERNASACQACATVPGIAYRVEAHDEECPGRAHSRRDRTPSAECVCSGERLPVGWENNSGNPA